MRHPLYVADRKVKKFRLWNFSRSRTSSKQDEKISDLIFENLAAYIEMGAHKRYSVRGKNRSTRTIGNERNNVNTKFEYKKRVLEILSLRKKEYHQKFYHCAEGWGKETKKILY